MSRVVVIGSGFAGLSAACFLAKEGFDVTILEKNESAGGRARKFQSNGFTFDMGPSWYWMPDVFEKFFNCFGKKVSDYYTLERLDPSYRIVYSKDDALDIPSGVDALCKMFDRLEPGSSKNLLQFLEEGKTKYDIGINKLVHNPGISLSELMDIDLVKGVFSMHVFQSISTYIRKFFKEPRLIQLLEFPVLFLGAKPENTPALYSLMNYADMALGTWYPKGGMYKIIDGMVALAKSLTVKFEFNSAVQSIDVDSTKAKGVWVNDTFREFDYIVASADYHHVEQHLLPQTHRTYTEPYWQKRTMAPSSLIFYLGLNKKIDNILHHTLFFDQNFEVHAREIYDEPKWPSSPQFYVSCTSQSDWTVAPEGCENLFILVPVAPGLEDSEIMREKYFHSI